VATTCCCKIVVGAVGIPIILTMRDCDNELIDVSGATTKQIILKSPAGSATTYTASYPTGETGVEGRIAYALLANNISAAGIWTAYAKVVKSGVTYISAPEEFDVLAAP
jgi:hypothetical protein